MDDIERRLAELSPAKLALLQTRIKRRQQETPQVTGAVLQRQDGSVFPLSFAQERIWLHQQLAPRSVVYNRPSNIRLRGPLDVEALRRALSDLALCHDSLRLKLVANDQGPTITCPPHVAVIVPFHDLSKFPDAESRCDQMAAHEARLPFTLQEGPMFRGQVLRISSEDHLLLLTFHHFAFDAWSMSILLKELARDYQAHCQAITPHGTKPAIRYVDFAAWDRSPDRLAALDVNRAYWKNKLASPPVLSFPSDFPRRQTPAETAGYVPLILPESLAAQIKVFAREQHTTVFNVLLAAYSALLHRHSSETDMVIGCPVAGRNHVETEQLIGVFINPLPVRLGVDAKRSFRQHLQGVHETVLADLEHQDVPLQLIVADVLHRRDGSGSPLFQAMFIHERFALEPQRAGELLFQPDDRPAPATMVDLALETFESSAGLTGRLVYRSALFNLASVERIAVHFFTLLASALEDPDREIGQLPLLDSAERRRVLLEWNNTAVAIDRNVNVHQLIEAQVENTPRAIAALCEDRELTYTQLNARANQLARHLRGLGLGPETLVALSVDRSVDLIIGILGILKAGGAYLPLDFNHPRQRLEFILNDAGVKFIVTQQSVRERLPDSGCQVITLDGDAAVLDTLANSNPVTSVEGSSLAYVMYTSGSTGQPKGVQITHGSVVNVLKFMASTPGLDSTDRLLSITASTFDISVLELILPLTVGASVEILPSHLTSDAAAILSRVDSGAVTALQATPATWQMLVQHPWKTRRRLKALSGGEELSDDVARKLQPRCRQLWNLYGPTETTIYSTVLQVTSGKVDRSIGRPIANTQLYVLDEWRQPVPIGVAGELYIGGAGVARGYLNRPELTAERFVPNPFVDDPETRLHRTGDSCRWRADGTIEFLGRIDSQIKLRGFRIETGEIESALQEDPGVAQCVVVLRQDGGDGRRLVAYCVPKADTQLIFTSLRQHLRQRLPDYMVPAAFVTMASLPLTSSGKIDRRALPTPDDSRPEIETGYVAPLSNTEKKLASLWQQSLAIEKVGVHDNFFELGGHSLLVARMVEQANRTFAKTLNIAAVFRTPTIAQIAALVDKGATAAPASVAQREGRFLRILKEGDGSLAVLCIAIPTSQFLLQLPQSVSLLELPIEPHRHWGIDQQADAYAMEVQRAAPSGPIIVAGYSYGGLLAFAVACRLRRRYNRKLEVVLVEPSSPMSLVKQKTDLAPTETYAERRTRHLHALRQMGARRWLPYLFTKLAKQVQTRTISPLVQRFHWPIIGWRIRRGLFVDARERWAYVWTIGRGLIRKYKPDSLPGDAHLLGRTAYFEKHLHFWRGTIENCINHILPNYADHRDLIESYQAHPWIDLIHQLVFQLENDWTEQTV